MRANGERSRRCLAVLIAGCVACSDERGNAELRLTYEADNLSRDGLHREALERLSAAIELFPEHHCNYVARAREQRLLGDRADAIADYRAAWTLLELERSTCPDPGSHDVTLYDVRARLAEMQSTTDGR